MHFSDFGVKDESELEQDEFSLSRPTFGKDNQLTVIGWKGKLVNTKYYIVKCSECSKDPELFGDGIFRITKNHLNVGKHPCECSSHFMWSEIQYKVLIKRKCKEREYTFHKFAEKFKGSRTKLRLECPTHGVWETTSIESFLRKGGTGCPKCKANKIKIINTLENNYHINKFMATGKFKEGTKFWRSNRVDYRGYNSFWNYTCPICSNDEYVKVGLCSGVFENTRSHLSIGRVSCRCSNIYRWKQEQYEYRIKKKMQESKTPDEFVGFVDGFKNHRSKFTRFCKTHGEYETTVDAYLNMDSCCQSCSNQNQQECYINLVKDSDSIIALKFGIAKNSKQRIKDQNRASSFNVEQYNVWTFPDVKACKAAEKFIKQNLKCKVLTKQEMPDGYTETTSVENLREIIKIYEDFGGVRKIINNKEQLIENTKNKEAA